MYDRRCSLTVALLIVCSAARAQSAEPSTQANVVTEIRFEAAQQHADPFNDVELDVVFTDPRGREFLVPAFWAGGTVWKARYASPVTGKHTWQSICSQHHDDGLQGKSGTITVEEYTGDNPLYRHGPVKVAENRRHFAHEDGTPFFWMGDTWWMQLSKRMRLDEFHTLAADRREKGFNVVQLVAGIFPDMVPFDEKGANEAGFPWTKDYSRLNPEYFNEADKRMIHIVEQGMSPCIVGAWGFHINWMPAEKMQQHWRHIIARWGAYPVIWCVAGEANLDWYLNWQDGVSPETPEQAAKWIPVMRYVREADPFQRMVSIHPTALGRMSSRGVVTDANVDLLDFDMLQTGHSKFASLGPTVDAVETSYNASPVLPVINSEVVFENLMGWNGPEIQRTYFWACILSGAVGHTYGANGVWQINRKGDPFGESPGGNNWGATPWDEAMQYDGGMQVAWGGRFLQRYPWHRFEPHPEWATWEEANSVAPIWGDWIWHEPDTATKGAPAEGRFFRREFDLPKDDPVMSAQIFLSADSEAHAYINGEHELTHSGFTNYGEAIVSKEQFEKGRNVLAVYAVNAPADVPVNPGAFTCTLQVTLKSGREVVVPTDASWKSSIPVADEQWHTLNASDDEWSAASVVAPSGAPPWGTPGQSVTRSNSLRPYAAGIVDDVRIFYLPLNRPAVLRELGTQQAWHAKWVNPVTGHEVDIGRIESDANGECKLPAAPEDWSDSLVVLEKEQ